MYTYTHTRMRPKRWIVAYESNDMVLEHYLEHCNGWNEYIHIHISHVYIYISTHPLIHEYTYTYMHMHV